MFIEDDYIFLVPKYNFAPMHKHSMLHIFLSLADIEVISVGNSLCGNFFMIDSFYEHEVKMNPSKALIYLIDPSSNMADILRQKYLKNLGIVKIEPNEEINELLSDINSQNLESKSKQILEILGIKKDFQPYTDKDERILKVIAGIKNGIYIDMEVKEIAKEIFLSESRLSHLFKLETGMNLKNYILMNKMKNAFMKLQSGKNITESAIDANFYDSAHLCNLVKKTTGINITEILKK